MGTRGGFFLALPPSRLLPGFRVDLRFSFADPSCAIGMATPLTKLDSDCIWKRERERAEEERERRVRMFKFQQRKKNGCKIKAIKCRFERQFTIFAAFQPPQEPTRAEKWVLLVPTQERTAHRFHHGRRGVRYGEQILVKQPCTWTDVRLWRGKKPPLSPPPWQAGETRYVHGLGVRCYR